MAVETDLNEAEIVQNCALGAALIWRFGIAYQAEKLSEPPPLPLTFLVLPICLHSPSLEAVLSTRKSSGMALFAAKVGETRENLLAIHHRVLALRQLSLESLGQGIRAGLLSINYAEASVRANASEQPQIPTRIKPIWDGADRFGHWSARLELPHISSILRVDF
jgi:hypothetical protein